MGRKRKYHTKEELRLAQNAWAKKYYYKNKDQIRKKARDKYELSKGIRPDSNKG